MTAKLPLRISSVILFLFALGHTVGFLSFRPKSAQALEVRDAMERVPFEFGGTTAHWMDLFVGFGLAISVSGFVSAIIAWRLSRATAGEIPLARTMAWLLCAIQLGGIIISMRYFAATQAIFSAAAAAALAWSAVKLRA